MTFLRKGKCKTDDQQILSETHVCSFCGTEIGSVTGGCVSWGSDQLVPQNATVAGCPALSLFYGTHS